MAELVINFDELNLRELFEVQNQRLCNGVQRAIRLTISKQIHMYTSICKDQPAIACKTVEDLSQSLVPFHIAGTLEKFIEHSCDAFF